MSIEHSPGQSSAFAGRVFSIKGLAGTGFASVRTIYRLLKDEEISGFYVGTSPRIDGDSVQAYVDRNPIKKPDAA